MMTRPSILPDILGIYFLVIIAWLTLGAVLVALFANPADRRLVTRFMWLAPVWPIGAIFVFITGLLGLPPFGKERTPK